MAVSLVREGFAWSACPAKRVIGTVERYLDEAGARSAIAVLLAEINSDKCGWAIAQLRSRSSAIISSNGNSQGQHMAQLLDQEDVPGVPNPLVLPHWRHYELAEVRTIQVESWLRRLPLQKVVVPKFEI